jgi:hypothetical protein
MTFFIIHNDRRWISWIIFDKIFKWNDIKQIIIAVKLEITKKDVQDAFGNEKIEILRLEVHLNYFQSVIELLTK